VADEISRNISTIAELADQTAEQASTRHCSAKS
jgi:hypothetical protein